MHDCARCGRRRLVEFLTWDGLRRQWRCTATRSCKNHKK